MSSMQRSVQLAAAARWLAHESGLEEAAALLDAAHDGAGSSAIVHMSIAPHNSARVTAGGGLGQLTDGLHEGWLSGACQCTSIKAAYHKVHQLTETVIDRASCRESTCCMSATAAPAAAELQCPQTLSCGMLLAP